MRQQYPIHIFGEKLVYYQFKVGTTRYFRIFPKFNNEPFRNDWDVCKIGSNTFIAGDAAQ